MLKCISPYLPNRNSTIFESKNVEADLYYLQNEEISFTKLLKLRKWLNFSRKKVVEISKLFKFLGEYSFPCITSARKYLLLFLVGCIYICKNSTAHKELDDMKFRVNGE